MDPVNEAKQGELRYSVTRTGYDYDRNAYHSPLHRTGPQKLDVCHGRE